MTGWESQLRKGVVELAVLAAIGQERLTAIGSYPTWSGWPVFSLPRARSIPCPAARPREDSGDPEGRIAIGPKQALPSAHAGRSRTTPPVGGELEDGFRVAHCIT